MNLTAMNLTAILGYFILIGMKSDINFKDCQVYKGWPGYEKSRHSVSGAHHHHHQLYLGYALS